MLQKQTVGDWRPQNTKCIMILKIIIIKKTLYPKRDAHREFNFSSHDNEVLLLQSARQTRIRNMF
jgi:hypothetical protein